MRPAIRILIAIGLASVTAIPAATAETHLSLRDLAKRAAMGELDARFELGWRLKRGIDVPADPHAALEHLCAAARGGHGQAAFTMGRMFLTGIGLPSDETQAAAWFARAATAGHAEAAAELAALPRADADDAACNGRELAENEYRPPARLVHLIRRMAPRYDLDPDFVLAVVAVESAFRTDAVSPMQARGLMQLTDATSERFGVANPMDAEQNLRGGMRFLAALVDRYGGDLPLVLAAYNAGPGAVDRYDGVPPFAETQAYIVKVRRYYPRDRHPVPQPAVDTQVADAEPGGGGGGIAPPSRIARPAD